MFTTTVSGQIRAGVAIGPAASHQGHGIGPEQRGDANDRAQRAEGQRQGNLGAVDQRHPQPHGFGGAARRRMLVQQ
ncbi:hypothetical protein WJ974_25235 [Achromobacter xylosoxidans]